MDSKRASDVDPVPDSFGFLDLDSEVQTWNFFLLLKDVLNFIDLDPDSLYFLDPDPETINPEPLKKAYKK